MAKEIKVKVPGSTANIGAGFDCLSIALSRYVWASTFGDGEPCDSNSIIRTAYEQAGGSNQIWFGHNLEPGRGLGFSAAARAAGAAVAFMEDGASLEESKDAVFKIVTELEGHGDNAAASVYGKFNIVCQDVAYQLELPNLKKLFLWIAKEQSSTDKSRMKISEHLSVNDAVFNISNVALLVSSLYENRFEHLRVATQDKIHQNIRLQASPESEKVLLHALNSGVDAVWLSGGGPSIAMIASAEQQKIIKSGLPELGLAIELEVDNLGIQEVL